MKGLGPSGERRTAPGWTPASRGSGIPPTGADPCRGFSVGSHLEDRFWRIPSARMKNREPHVIPLSTGAMAVLERLKVATGNLEWLFPSPVGTGPLVALAKHVQRIRQRTAVSFQLRDVRRTVRTRFREMGVSQDVSEAILSHARQGSFAPTTATSLSLKCEPRWRRGAPDSTRSSQARRARPSSYRSREPELVAKAHH